MIRNGGGLIDVTLCDGFLYCASVFSKSIPKATFSFPYVLDLAFGALYHIHEIRRRAGDVMPYTFLLVSSEESVRRGSFFNKTARFTPSSSECINVLIRMYLVLRAHLPFGQHQDTCLGADQKARGGSSGDGKSQNGRVKLQAKMSRSSSRS